MSMSFNPALPMIDRAAQERMRQNALQALKSTQYSKIMAHEMAHKSAAGQYGGAIHIDYNSQGVAVGGHVPISTPGLNPKDPASSIKAYQTIKNAAKAPGPEASAKDNAVASMAQAQIGRAQVLMNQKQQRLLKNGLAS